MLHTVNVQPSMFAPIFTLILFFLLLAIAWIFFKKWAEKILFRKANEFYTKPKNPLTKFEQDFFKVATNALPDHIILSQVDIKQVVNFGGGNKTRYMEKLGLLSLDFVVLDKNFNLKCCIELDDPTHNDPKRKALDGIKDTALEGIGKTLLRFTRIPTPEMLKGKLESI